MNNAKAGQFVKYYPDHYDIRSGMAPGNEYALVAIITYVSSDALVNLTVFDANGVTHGKTNVALVAPGEDQLPANGYAEIECEAPIKTNETKPTAKK